MTQSVSSLEPRLHASAGRPETQAPGPASVLISAKAELKNDTRAARKSADCLRARGQAVLIIPNCDNDKTLPDLVPREFGGLAMSVMNGLYDLGDFGPTDLKKTSCSCWIIQIIVWMSLTIRHRVCGQKLIHRVWVAALDLENRSPLCQGESRTSCWNRLSLLVYNVTNKLGGKSNMIDRHRFRPRTSFDDRSTCGTR